MPAQGRIVMAEVLDPQGENPKIRPVVIVTPDDEIKPGSPFVGVAVTGTLPKRLTSEYVPLPYHPDGRARTQLDKKNAAKCDWLVVLSHEQIVDYKGWVPQDAMVAITNYLAAHEDY